MTAPPPADPPPQWLQQMLPPSTPHPSEQLDRPVGTPQPPAGSPPLSSVNGITASGNGTSSGSKDAGISGAGGVPKGAPSPDINDRPATWASSTPEQPRRSAVPLTPASAAVSAGAAADQAGFGTGLAGLVASGMEAAGFGEFAVNILLKQHPDLDRAFIKAMAAQRGYSIEATDQYLTEFKNKNSGLAPGGVVKQDADGNWKTVEGKFEGSDGV